MTWNGIEIKTDFVYSPIPIRTMDWAAWLDGHEERGSTYGPSRNIAIANLLQELWEATE